MKKPIKWTDSAIMRITVESQRDFQHHSKPGLRLRAYPSGEKRFLWLRDRDKHTSRDKLGPFPLHSAKDAERWADDLNEKFEAGKSIQPPERMTVAEGWTKYVVQLMKDRKPGSVAKRKAAGMLDIVGALGDKFIADVTPSDILTVVARPIERGIGCTGGKVRSNYVLSLARTFFKFCEDFEFDGITRNPCRAVKPIERIDGQRPERILTLRETALLILAAREYDKRYGRSLADALTVMAMNGCRKSEVYHARRDEWNPDRCEWVIPGARYKTGVDCVLPVGPTSAAIFNRAAGEDGFVFAKQAGIRLSADVYEFDTKIRKLMEEIGGETVPRFTTHAIRYGFRTNISELEIADDELAERIIHPKKKLGMSQKYRPRMLKQKRDALAAWDAALNAEIASIVGERMRIVA